MPTLDQIRLFFGHFPIPIAISIFTFYGIWRLKNKANSARENGSLADPLDIWPLAIAYAVGHHAIEGLSGFPPTDSFDWLPYGLLGVACVATLGQLSKRVPTLAINALAVLTSLVALGLSLNGFKIYHDQYSLFSRLIIFATLALALLCSTVALTSIARRLYLIDFFVLYIILGTIAASTLFIGFNSAAIAQLLGLTLAITGTGLVVGLITKRKQVSTTYVIGAALIWTLTASYSYLGNITLPPAPSICLLLATPTIGSLGLLLLNKPERPVLTRLAVAVPAIIAAMLAFSLSSQQKEATEETDSYEYWES